MSKNRIGELELSLYMTKVPVYNILLHRNLYFYENEVRTMKSDRIAILIKQKALAIDKFAGQVLAPYELSNTQYKVMKFLYSQPDTVVRQADIELKFSLTNPTVTGIIQNLEKKGLVQRIPNPNDKRSKLLTLTKQAMSIKDELYQIGESIESYVTANLTENECDELVRILNKIEEK